MKTDDVILEVPTDVQVMIQKWGAEPCRGMLKLLLQAQRNWWRAYREGSEPKDEVRERLAYLRFNARACIDRVRFLEGSRGGH